MVWGNTLTDLCTTTRFCTHLLISIPQHAFGVEWVGVTHLLISVPQHASGVEWVGATHLLISVPQHFWLTATTDVFTTTHFSMEWVGAIHLLISVPQHTFG